MRQRYGVLGDGEAGGVWPAHVAAARDALHRDTLGPPKAESDAEALRRAHCEAVCTQVQSASVVRAVV